jgi:hypothetical protein
VADFIEGSMLTDEFHVPFMADTPSLGYGVLLGYLAALEEFGR